MKLSALLTLAAAALSLGLLAQTAKALDPVTPKSVVLSSHNLNTKGFDISDAYGKAQVCQPCHTPHGVPAANQNLSRLWNHTLNAASSYKLNSGAGVSVVEGGSTITAIDETSRKCLGCHDGTIALDSYGTHAGTSGATMNSGYVIGPGKDLTHDHPIDVQYNGASSYTGGLVNDSAGKKPTDTGYTTTYGLVWTTSARNNDPSKFTTSGYYSQIWGSQTYSKTAISAISFYKPSGVTVAKDSNISGTNVTYSTQALYVYCNSCHTPHDSEYHFMRVPNDSSQVCLTCHNK